LLAGGVAFLSSAKSSLADSKTKPNKKGLTLPKELVPRPVTLQEKQMPLATALAELNRQTGNQVEDRRQAKDNVSVKLDLKDVTFWQALDAIAKEADAKVSVFESDGKVALVDGPYQAIPVSYSGLFRASVKRIDLFGSLDSDDHDCIVYLQVAWEPRFRPLFIQRQPTDLVVQDDKGRALEVPEGDSGPAPLGGKAAAEVRVRVAAPRRSATHLGVFKGKMAVIGPSKTLTFTFDKLSPITKAADARKETQDGVSVHLRELRNEGESDEQNWVVGLLLDYPAEGPKFESFQSWLVNNEIYLEREKDGLKQRLPANLGYETGDQGVSNALIRYRFGDEPQKNLLLGKFSDWKVVYVTPGKIAELPFTFEFKDLPLP
jgi:hypothetical protein